MSQSGAHLKRAEKGAQISLVVYLIVSALKSLAGILLNAQSLLADGLNNFTDAFSSIAVLIGLRSARKPADEDHRYGHWKAESIASLVTSLLMFVVALSVLQESISSFVTGEKQLPSYEASWISLMATFVLFVLHLHNKRLAHQTKSHGLQAMAKDNLADALTSFVTGIAIFASQYGMAWIDSLMALFVGLVILRTSYQIFRDNVFELSDGFDEEKLAIYSRAVAEIPGIKNVKTIRGRMYGNHIYLDITLVVPDLMTVKTAHELADQTEDLLKEEFGVTHTHVHLAPMSQEE